MQLGLTKEERYVAGKARRQAVPRASHAALVLSAMRDPLAILAEADAARLTELVPIRYARMAESPFAFLRGSVAIMAADLIRVASPDLVVQACGDCHLMNFGAFSTPEAHVLFDINDFDETLAGIDFTVDLKRLVASVAVAALEAAFSREKAERVARSAARAYRKSMHALAARSPIEIWHAMVNLPCEAKRIKNAAVRNRVQRLLERALANEVAEDNDNYPHLVRGGHGMSAIDDRPPLIYHFRGDVDQRHTLNAGRAFACYYGSLAPERRILAERYTLSDIAFKVVGVGSVGTFCAIGLFLTPDGDPLFLQVKEAQLPVLEKLRRSGRSGYSNQGRRIVEGQRIMQAASDVFLGWFDDEATDRYFYVRHLKNRHLGTVAEIMESGALEFYAALCGRTLARAHARSGDPVMLAGYMGKSEVFDEALGVFAMTYADQTTLDHTALCQALKASRSF